MSCLHLPSVTCAECRPTGAIIVVDSTPLWDQAERQKQKLELAKLRDAFEDAIALLRDWEDYDPADRECTWKQRRDEFLAEHEEAGR